MRLYASLKFFVFTLFGSAFMLLGFLALYFKSEEMLGFRSFSMIELSEIGAAGGAFTGTFAFLVFSGLFLGFAVKVPMWPLPHLAPRCTHGRTDHRFGDPRCHPPEARHLWIHQDRHPDPP